MIKKIVCIFLLVKTCFSGNLESDKIEVNFSTPTAQSKGYLNKITGCAFSENIESLSDSISIPGNESVALIKKIVDFSGLPMNFKVFSAPINNAMATVVDSSRLIIFDSNTINGKSIKKNNLISTTILAHEIGHHLAGHTLSKNRENTKAELEADKYAGSVLFKLGINLHEVIMAYNNLPLKGSNSHPGKSERVNAISQGWRDAAILKDLTVIPPPPPDLPDDYNITTLKNGENDPLEHEGCDKRGPYSIVLLNVDSLRNTFKFEFLDTQGYNQSGKNFYRDEINYNDIFHEESRRKLSTEIFVPGRKLKIWIYMCGSGGFRHLGKFELLKSNFNPMQKNRL